MGENNRIEQGKKGSESPVEPVSKSKKRAEAGEVVAVEVAAVKAISQEGARADVAGAAAEGLAEELPPGEWADAYHQLKDQVAKNPESQGPLTDGLLAILHCFAKYMHFGDLLPGRFVSRLDSDTSLKEEKFKPSDLKKVLSARRDQKREQESAEKLKSEPKKTGIERASTSYVCSVLGVENTENALVLAARLQHSSKDLPDGEKAAYYRRVADLQTLQANGAPYGTVLIFISSLERGERVTAFATGNKDEFKYFDPQKGAAGTFRLSEENSPLKSGIKFLAAFVPRFNSDATYFSQPNHAEELDENLSVSGEIEEVENLTGSAKVGSEEFRNRVRAAATPSVANETVASDIAGVGKKILALSQEFIEGGEDSQEMAIRFHQVVKNYLIALETAIDGYKAYEAKQIENTEELNDAKKILQQFEEDRKAAEGWIKSLEEKYQFKA